MKIPKLLLLGVLVAGALDARAGISSIVAHGATFQPGDTIPLFVESGTKNSIMVKGQFMDLCTGVESSDSSFSPSIGRRVVGSNSAVEILVGAGSAPDADGGTIHIKFAMGEETFKVKAFRTKVTSFEIEGHGSSCTEGQLVVLVARGEVENLTVGASGAMLDAANPRYDVAEKLSVSTPSAAKFALTCTDAGTFTVNRQWFKDARVSGVAGETMTRGSATLTVTVNPIIRKPVP